jgi:hypothetical protein
VSITFLAEISNRTKIKPQFTPDESVSRQYGIYRLYTGARPQNTYWTDWGGVYDNPVAFGVEIRFTEWLFPVTSMADLIAVENSCFESGGYLYIHVPVHTWIYPEAEVTMAVRKPYLSGPKRADIPSDMVLNGNYAEARLSVPGIGVRLSDVISGITLFGSFNIALDNHDGKFDGADAVELFNSPAQLRKSVAEYPEYEDFHKIREGIIESVKVDSGKITLSVADRFRAFDGQVCGLINAGGYPAEKPDALGKPLPVAFGTVTMPLIEIAGGRYLAAEYI